MVNKIIKERKTLFKCGCEYKTQLKMSHCPKHRCYEVIEYGPKFNNTLLLILIILYIILITIITYLILLRLG